MGSIVYKAELDQLEYTQIYTVYVIQTQPACINSPAIHEQSYSKRRSGRPYSPEKQRRQFVLPSDFILVLTPRAPHDSSTLLLESIYRIYRKIVMGDVILALLYIQSSFLPFFCKFKQMKRTTFCFLFLFSKN